MKERPIIFNDEMVRAILEGRKTQTRRVIKGNPVSVLAFIGRDNQKTGEYGLSFEHERVIEKHIKCPYGEPGDRLWVREIFVVESNRDVTEIEDYNPPFDDGRPVIWEEGPDYGKYWAQCHYRATDPKPDLVQEGKDGPACIWRPQLHMSRELSRILLEIEWVRVQPLQDITEEDAQAEGLKLLQGGIRSEFAVLWDKIYKDRPALQWKNNPWVWVINFKVLEPTKA